MQQKDYNRPIRLRAIGLTAGAPDRRRRPSRAAGPPGRDPRGYLHPPRLRGRPRPRQLHHLPPRRHRVPVPPPLQVPPLPSRARRHRRGDREIPPRRAAAPLRFTFSFLPKPNRWRTRDVRDGRVLLSAPAPASSLGDLVVCDPLHRRYVLIPSIPGDQVASARYFDYDKQEFEPFLAPASEEKESSSFRAMCNVLSNKNRESRRTKTKGMVSHG
ncbi:hypothetical protein SETIT_3G385200v2 [Setaria italica]|uniref:Uncharacterized protein n=1 Tax=Setaria italica TaxID=4555 RepID=A0A368QN88_SETIT|nr:hypothetical protein SETIT_3G385200v2 [Setaria italica]